MEKFIGSIDHNLPDELVTELKARDRETKKRQWANFESKLEYNAREITEAFKSMYELYDDGLVKWMANLYDPDICVCNEVYGKSVCEHHPLCGTGAFHYTHSGRDNVGFMPVIEATYSVYGFVEDCGFTSPDRVKEYLGDEIGEKLTKFAENLQDPDGYFYHPHWGKDIGVGRRGRDLVRAEGLLARYGKKPKYPTISDVAAGEKNDNLYIPDNMKTLDAFKEYLSTLDIDHRSYHVGSMLGEQRAQLKARGQEYIDVLFDYFNEHQRKDNGIWHEKCDYYGTNGVMKIVYSYYIENRPIPMPEKVFRAALSAIMSEEDAETVVIVWNPWVTVWQILQNIEQFYSPELARKLRLELYEKAPEAIRITKKKTAKFKKPDGAFSYLQKYSTPFMQGSPCAIPETVEGDMDASVLGTNSMVRVIAKALGISSEDTVPLYGEYESAVFKNILENRKPVRKGDI